MPAAQQVPPTSLRLAVLFLGVGVDAEEIGAVDRLALDQFGKVLPRVVAPKPLSPAVMIVASGSTLRMAAIPRRSNVPYS